MEIRVLGPLEVVSRAGTDVGISSAKQRELLALLAAHADAPGAFIQPVHDGRSGHPVVWPHAAIAPILSLRPTDSPRTFLASTAAPPRARTPVQDPAVLDNIDRPAAYQALLQRDHEGPSQL